MKKVMAMCLLLGVFLLNAVPAMAAIELPFEIREAFQHADIISAAQWNEPDKDTCFVLVRTKEGTNSLVCFINENGTWIEEFSTREAIPQGDNRVDLQISDGAWSFRNAQNDARQYLEGPILIILQYGIDGGSIEQMLSFQRSDMGGWNLIALRNYPVSAVINIDAGAVTYYRVVTDKGQDMVIGTAPCGFERDLRYLRLSDIPLTFQQAQDMEK